MNKIAFAFSALFLLLLTPSLQAQQVGSDKAVQPIFIPGRVSQDDLRIQAPEHLEKNKPLSFAIGFLNLSHRRLHDGKGSLTFIVNGIPQDVLFSDGRGVLTHTFKESFISIYCDDFRYQQEIGARPGWIYLVPALLIPAIAIGARRRKQKRAGNAS
jgi:hypothetical protein